MALYIGQHIRPRANSVQHGTVQLVGKWMLHENGPTGSAPILFGHYCADIGSEACDVGWADDMMEVDGNAIGIEPSIEDQVS